MCFSAATLQRRSILISEKGTYRDGYIEAILPNVSKGLAKYATTRSY